MLCGVVLVDVMRHLGLRLARGRTTDTAVSLLCAALLHAQGASSAEPQPSSVPQRSPAESVCFDQHEIGQELRQGGKLLESRGAFLACAASSCPSAVQRDCQRWSSEVQAQLPSVIFRVSLDGKARADVSLSIDGVPQPGALAEPIVLDPGVHRYRVVLAAASPLEGELTLQAGEPLREVSVELQQLEPARHVPLLSWVLGGVGVTGTASFIGFGLSSRALERKYEASCSPLCSDRQIDRVRERSLIANISLGVGLTSLATAGALYFLSRPEEPTKTERPTLQLGLVPVGGGLLGNLQLRAF
ncbi:MAG: hypothetical protein ABI895_30905 [Deltaproteobacteria bacterium]